MNELGDQRRLGTRLNLVSRNNYRVLSAPPAAKRYGSSLPTGGRSLRDVIRAAH